MDKEIKNGREGYWGVDKWLPIKEERGESKWMSAIDLMSYLVFVIEGSHSSLGMSASCLSEFHLFLLMNYVLLPHFALKWHSINRKHLKLLYCNLFKEEEGEERKPIDIWLKMERKFICREKCFTAFSKKISKHLKESIILIFSSY